MSFLLIKIIVLVIATAIAAYTDYKTSYIFNWLSLPLISLGLISITLESFVFKNPLGWNYFLNVLGISVLIYAIGYVFYYYGKLGFGDIKLFIGINLLLPYFYGKVTILWLLILSSLSSVLIVSIKYIFILVKKIKKKEWKKIIKERRSNILKSSALLLMFLVLFGFSIFNLHLSLWFLVLLIPIILGLFISVFDHEIKKYIYTRNKKISKLDDGDVLAMEFISKSMLKKLGMGNREVIEDRDLKRFKKLDIKEIPIYDNLPRFGPYILVGLIIFLIIAKYLVI